MAAVWILTVIGYYGFGNLATLELDAEGHSVVSSLGYSAISFIGYPVGSALSMLFMERLERKWILGGACLAMSVFGVRMAILGSPRRSSRSVSVSPRPAT
jgi:putative MFS transporter